MSYLVLARKYRPAAFDSVSGQEHVTRTLANSIKRNKVAHAILLAGPRGVGKTSIARIIAKCLNCEKGPTAEPCLLCTNCREITNGTSLAVREIDGASHNSVDNVRELIDTFRSLPAPGSRYKVYIIDEVHMLSTAAFNALLKSLEEPPPHTVFILATTDVHKVPETVISRCQRHDLRSLGSDIIEDRLTQIATSEKLKAEPGVLRMIARLADGSMRDAQSLLDRVHSFCDGELSLKDTSRLLGTADKNSLYNLSQAVFAHEPARVLELLGAIFSTGVDPALFIREFVAHFRELLVAKFGGSQMLERLGVPKDDQVELLRQVEPMGRQDIQDLVEIAREGADSAIRSSYPKYAMEALLVRMAVRESVQDLGELLHRVKSGMSGMVDKTTASLIQPSHSGERPKVATPDRVPARDAGSPLDWGAFVRFASEHTSKVLTEHLKRLSIVQFQGGFLDAQGPEFSVNSIKQKADLEKLTSALQQFSGIGNWRVTLHPGDSAGTSEPGSLHHDEKEKKQKTREAKEQSITSHPQIQNLQKAFPGSTIEGIKLKDV